jgi:acylphosphatase
MPKRVNIQIMGQVQGVGFRYHAKQLADQLGLAGFVRNQSDGTVLIEVQGDTIKLDQFLDWCRQGPPAASVRGITVSDSQLFCEPGFNIR